MVQLKTELLNPLFLLVVLTAQFVATMSLYPGYIEYLYRMATFSAAPGLITSVFPFTYASAIGLFGCMVWRFRLLGVILGGASVFSATSLFEIVYQAFRGNLAYWPLNLSCIAWGGVILPYATVGKRFLLVFGVCVGLWIGWLVAGFPQIDDSQTIRVYEAYTFNVPLKVLTFALYMISLRSTERSGILASRCTN